MDDETKRLSTPYHDDDNNPRVDTSYEGFMEGDVLGLSLTRRCLGWVLREGEDGVDRGLSPIASNMMDISQVLDEAESRRRNRRARRCNDRFTERRDCLKHELERLGFLIPESDNPTDHPVIIRQKLLNGEDVEPGGVYRALLHIARNRGYQYDFPWTDCTGDEIKQDTDDGDSINFIQRDDLHDKHGYDYPAEFLAPTIRENNRHRSEGRPGDADSSKNYAFHRSLLQDEARTILEHLADDHPELHEPHPDHDDRSNLEYLLYGDSELHDGVPVYTYHTEDGGIFGQKEARIQNRNVGLDKSMPYDENGYPQQVCRRDDPIAIEFAMARQARGLYVVDPATDEQVQAPADLRLDIRKKLMEKMDNKQPEITNNELESIVYDHGYELKPYDRGIGEDNEPTSLTVDLKGRADHARPFMQQQLDDGLWTDDGPIMEPEILVRPNETREEAIERIIQSVSTPVVKHALSVYDRVLETVRAEHGTPDFIVFQGQQSLAYGEEKLAELKDEQKKNERLNERARDFWSDCGVDSPSERQMKLYRVLYETIGGNRYPKPDGPVGTCPICLNEFTPDEIDTIELDHLTPRHVVKCDETKNLIPVHAECNEAKDNKTPADAFGDTTFRKTDWGEMKTFAKDHFSSRKFELFTETNPEEDSILRRKYTRCLEENSYLTRQARKIAMIKFNWLHHETARYENEGADNPDTQAVDPSSHSGTNIERRFMSVDTQTTAMFRRCWGLSDTMKQAYAQLLDRLDRDLEAELAEDERSIDFHNVDYRKTVVDALVDTALYVPTLRKFNSPAAYWTTDDDGNATAKNPRGFDVDTALSIIPTDPGDDHYRPVRSKESSTAVTDRTLFGKRTVDVDGDEQTVYVKNTAVENLTNKSALKTSKKTYTKSIYPYDLRCYIKEALEAFREDCETILYERRRQQAREDEDGDPDDVSRKDTEYDFTDQPELLFDLLSNEAYQDYLSSDGEVVRQAKDGETPIKSVPLIKQVGDSAVIEVRPDTYKARAGYDCIEVFETPDGDRTKVIRYHWQHTPDHQAENATIPPGSESIAELRTGDRVKLSEDMLEDLNDDHANGKGYPVEWFVLQAKSGDYFKLALPFADYLHDDYKSKQKDKLRSLVLDGYSAKIDDLIQGMQNHRPFEPIAV